jgi:L-asparaginase II
MVSSSGAKDIECAAAAPGGDSKVSDIANPVLLEGGRQIWVDGAPGGLSIEIQHRGALAIARKGRVEFALGQSASGAFLRSAAKFFQALPAVADGVEDRYGLDERALALMCASHGGEPAHCEVARDMLARGGLGPEDLHCGPHAPMHLETAAAMRHRGDPFGRIHNNCSGKHAGMMLGARARGEDPQGYADPAHPVQLRIRESLSRLTGLAPRDVGYGIDGCGVPTFVLDLETTARAFSNFCSGAGRLEEREKAAARRLIAAVRARPHMIGGEGRFCSAVVEATGGRALVKIGADGFYGGMIPEAGLGFALHVDDGSWNASERVCAEILAREGVLDEAGRRHLAPWIAPERRNCAGEVIGSFRFLGW